MMSMMTMMTMNDRVEPGFSLTRARVERLLAMLDVKRGNGGLIADEPKAREVAELRLFGAGASPKKFARLEAQQVDGVLRDQYRFSGGFQTGRLSSRGAQIQNLTRDVLGESQQRRRSSTRSPRVLPPQAAPPSFFTRTTLVVPFSWRCRREGCSPTPALAGVMLTCSTKAASRPAKGARNARFDAAAGA
jgi:hypothetical protein